MSAITLWKHQELGVNQVAQLAGQGTRRIVFQLATGGGKTVAFSALTERFLKSIRKRVIIAVHRDRLAHQTVQALKEVSGIEAGYLIAGYRNVVRRVEGDMYIPYNNAPVVVCMVETLNNRFKRYGKYLGEVGMLIVDECHRGEFHKIYSHFPNALTIGFSATPISSKKKFPMNMFFDEIVCPGSIRELIREKHLSKNITIGDKNGIDRKKMRVIGGEFNNKDMSQIFSSGKHVTNTVDAYEKYAIGDKTMVYNCNIAHSKLVMQEFVNRGYDARHLDGKASTEERDDTLQWFKETPHAILCSIELLTTGFDEPTIECIIVNRATMSLVLWIQMTGRGSRVHKESGKYTFKIIDLGNNIGSHLDWDYPHDWNYYFHHPEAASNGKGVAPTKTCPSCEAIIHLSAKICPFCKKDISKPTIYDAESLDLSVLTIGFNIEGLIAKNKNYKTYASLHIAKRQLVGRFRSRYKYTDCPTTVRDMLDQRWQTIVKDWCHQHGKRHNRWHKDTTRKWLMDELDKYYDKNDVPATA